LYGGRLDPVVEAAQALDLAVRLAKVAAALRDHVVMLLDDIVHASLRSLALGSLLYFQIAFLLALACGFAVGGRQACASTGALPLARR
jgi:hypothetical protein